MMTSATPCRAAVAALLTVAVGCGGDLTLPETSGSGFDLSRVAGDGQTGTVGSPLPDPLVVRVAAPGDAPVAGRRVAFIPVAGAAAARLDPDTALTDAQGQASTTWVLGTDPGTHQVEARLVADLAPPAPVTFSASAVAGKPDSLVAASELNRVGRRGQALTDPLVVRVADRFGNAVAGAQVTWELSSGKGELSASASTTGTDGTTAVNWTLGERVGVQEVTASLSGVHGSPVTFTATVLF